MARVTWSPEARAELKTISDFLSRSSTTYSRSIVSQASAAVDRLETIPYSGQVIPELEDQALREIIFRSYRIMYHVGGPTGSEDVRILSVLHASRQFGR